MRSGLPEAPASPPRHTIGAESLLHDENSNTPLELLQRTPSAKLDETIEELKKHRPAAEVRAALIELLVTAPLSEFPPIREAVMKHFGDAGR
jgi:hypothetical protein